jgi:O-antigen/teichoic acid export membrane protein
MIYGLGTIVPRVLNYLLLTPFFTYIFYKSEYGVFSELYAFVAVLLVVLTYGMETTYFRFAEAEKNKNKVFSTAFGSILFTSLLFVLLVYLFSGSISTLIRYPENTEYILWIAGIVAIDAIVSIPFAKLRQENKALKFALIKFSSVAINIGLNAAFFYEKWSASDPHSVQVSIEYIFIANFISSAFTLIVLLPEIIKIKPLFSFSLLFRMFRYSLPLLVVGAAGIINEHGDKIILKYLIVTSGDAMDQLGIYSANYRLAVLMTIFTQMFRYAAEPFFFAQEKEKNSKKTYADVMKYFTIFGLLIFLGVTLYIDVVKYFIGAPFREGLDIVPLILLANLFLGIYFNLSIWYKLTNRTLYGAAIAIVGMIITLGLNIILVPEFGFRGAAWATFFCYLSMMIISFLWGRKFYKITYDLASIALYFFLAIALYFAHRFLDLDSGKLSLIVATGFLGIFLIFVFYRENLMAVIKRRKASK